MALIADRRRHVDRQKQANEHGRERRPHDDRHGNRHFIALCHLPRQRGSTSDEGKHRGIDPHPAAGIAVLAAVRLIDGHGHRVTSAHGTPPGPESHPHKPFTAWESLETCCSCRRSAWTETLAERLTQTKAVRQQPVLGLRETPTLTKDK